MQTETQTKVQTTIYLSAAVKAAIEKDRLRLGQTQSLWIERACLQALATKGKAK